jgi:hypothetical protein
VTPLPSGVTRKCQGTKAEVNSFRTTLYYRVKGVAGEMFEHTVIASIGTHADASATRLRLSATSGRISLLTTKSHFNSSLLVVGVFSLLG